MPHTPGPYRFVCRTFPNGRLSGVPYIYAPGGVDDERHIAVIEQTPNFKDNGRLIAAAPDLLSACEALVFAARLENMQRMPAWAELLKDANSVIAKAKGE